MRRAEVTGTSDDGVRQVAGMDRTRQEGSVTMAMSQVAQQGAAGRPQPAPQQQGSIPATPANPTPQQVGGTSSTQFKDWASI